MKKWFEEAIVYHIFPLGCLGASWNRFEGIGPNRIKGLEEWINPIKQIGANTLMLGPLWESKSHGYETIDYLKVDPRLGTNEDFAEVCRHLKSSGLRFVIDGVFNHCGRDFYAFKDLREKGRYSGYMDWFSDLDFGTPNSIGDSFSYGSWNGHLDLVKFNLKNPSVKIFLMGVVEHWIRTYDIDGIRLDAADVIDKSFLKELSQFCKAIKPDFWLLGEVIHGDYRDWTPGAGLDSVTNYELYKGLWSSHVDHNYFEIAWSLERQFGAQGMYRGLPHLNFADNHDVDRIASTLSEASQLYPHAILTAMAPGLPCIYYGSEYGMEGKKAPSHDWDLRPAIAPNALDSLANQALRNLWATLNHLRSIEPSIQSGSYQQGYLSSNQFAFWRLPTETGRPILIAVNNADEAVSIEVDLPLGISQEQWSDYLNPYDQVKTRGSKIELNLWPKWGAVVL